MREATEDWNVGGGESHEMAIYAIRRLETRPAAHQPRICRNSALRCSVVEDIIEPPPAHRTRVDQVLLDLGKITKCRTDADGSWKLLRRRMDLVKPPALLVDMLKRNQTGRAHD